MLALLLMLLFPIVAWADHRPPPPISWTAERIREVDEIVKQALICPLEGTPEALQREQAWKEYWASIQHLPLEQRHPLTMNNRDMLDKLSCIDAENLLSQWEYRHFGSRVINSLPLEEGGLRESDICTEERRMQREHNPTWYWASIIDCPKAGSVKEQEREQWHRARAVAQKHLAWEQRLQQDIDDMKSGTYLLPCMDTEVRWLYEKLKERDEQKAQQARDKAMGEK